MKYTDGLEIDRNYSNGHEDNHGSVRYPNGDRYQGGLSGSTRQGNGRMTYNMSSGDS